MLLGWVILAIASIHLSRTLQMARVLLGTGQTDNARVWLGRVMTGLSLSPRIQLVACQHLASSFFLEEAYREMVPSAANCCVIGSAGSKTWRSTPG